MEATSWRRRHGGCALRSRPELTTRSSGRRYSTQELPPAPPPPKSSHLVADRPARGGQRTRVSAPGVRVSPLPCPHTGDDLRWQRAQGERHEARVSLCPRTVKEPLDGLGGLVVPGSSAGAAVQAPRRRRQRCEALARAARHRGCPRLRAVPRQPIAHRQRPRGLLLWLGRRRGRGRGRTGLAALLAPLDGSRDAARQGDGRGGPAGRQPQPPAQQLLRAASQAGLMLPCSHSLSKKLFPGQPRIPLDARDVM
jgi:hypothetical protein